MFSRRAVPWQYFKRTMFIVILNISDPPKGFIITVPEVDVVDIMLATKLRKIGLLFLAAV